MIRHVVMWKLKEDAEGGGRTRNAAQVKAWLDACGDLVPGILRFEVSLPQEGLEANCDVMLYAEFASPGALHAYNAHPRHQLLKTRIAPLREARHAFDCEA